MQEALSGKRWGRVLDVCFQTIGPGVTLAERDRVANDPSLPWIDVCYFVAVGQRRHRQNEMKTRLMTRGRSYEVLDFATVIRKINLMS